MSTEPCRQGSQSIVIFNLLSMLQIGNVANVVVNNLTTVGGASFYYTHSI